MNTARSIPGERPPKTLQHVRSEMLHILGLECLDQGDCVRAVAVLERAVRCDSPDVALLNDLGVALLAAGNPARAVSLFRRATQLAAQLGESHCNLGIALHKLGDCDAAVESLRRALSVEPGLDRARLTLSRILSDQGDSSEAESHLRGILTFRPDDPDALLVLGRVFASERRWIEAAECFDKVLHSRPSDLDALCALATVVDDSRLDGLTIRLAQTAAVVGSEDAQFLAQRALAGVAHLRRDVAAETEHRRRALVIRPDAVDLRVDLAKLLLLTGDFDTGWPAFEWRWRQSPSVLRPRSLLRPRWQGESLDGAAIALHAEQGFGSIIQFLRYVPLVARLGGRVVLEVPAELVRLMSSLEGVQAVIARGEPLPAVAWQCPLMSLPLAFRTTVESIPADIPYLHADQQEVHSWSHRLPPKYRVGLAWSGSSRHYNDRRRSMPAESLAPLGAVSGAHFVSLQLRSHEAMNRVSFPHVDLSDELTDFADTAAVIANLDLVITVDTAVAHLAGALGKPVWIMLPFAGEYRWLLDREDSPWYPTARLFRQPSPGDWRSVVASVAQELRRRISGEAPC